MPLGQTHDSFQWLTRFEHQISFHTNEIVAESSPSAISTTNPSGISDVILRGFVPAGKSIMH
ncbi:hypothetical protein BKA56DRAFT_605907 [Ilyonectria sp. MPI-CAGE-AT-0026]|nr:hypothetical protein BKA56DRAFT_605907 [Ilyonectria sp. MPI-CAGE-AT-0026]